MVDVAGLPAGFAFLAGVLTFFAPCSFPMLPGYVAYFLGTGTGDDGASRPGLPVRLWRAGVVGVVVSLGFFLVYGVLAGIAISLGARVLRDISVLEVVVGALLIVLGLGMVTGRLQVDQLHVQLPERRRTTGGYFLFGVIYAVAAAGCTAPLFVAIATLAINSGPAGAVLILGAYALGMSVLMVGITLASAVGRAGTFRVVTQNTDRINRAAGALLALAGVAQIYLFVFDFDPLGGLKALGLV